MFQIPVYRAERDAGLEQAVRAKACVTLASVARAAEAGELSDGAVARLRTLATQFAKGDVNDLDLHHLSTILVTVGWNKNDDVFDGMETWVSRHSPSDKQLNYEHDDAQIVGHITANHVMDAEGKVLADETCVDDLPAKFHIVTAGVLYKHWQKPELQKRMDDLIAEIAQGKWFVSMECLFKGFDYCLKDAAGGARVVARNDKTAFLSKHLRAYGGTGHYGQYRVGRVLRNIVFSGKGLVRNPANPESVILTSDTEVVATSGEVCAEFPALGAEQVYSPPTHESTEQPKESAQVMTITVEQVQAELASAKAEIEKLKSSQNEAVVSDLKARLDATVAAKAEADALLLKAGEALKVAASTAEAAGAALGAKVETLTSQLEEANKSLAEVRDELKTIYAEKTKLTRVATAKEKLKLEEAAAAKFVADTAVLSDETFAAQVETMLTAMSAWTTNNPASGNTPFPGPGAKTPPKATSAPAAPKSTPAKTPAAKAGTETDDAGEGAADATDLGTASGSDAALSTSVTDSGVTDVQKAIASCFGVPDDAA